MSVVQIFPRAEEPAVQALPISPAAGPEAATVSPQMGAGMPAAAEPPPVSEPYPLDRAFHAMLARFTGGISPLALSLAWLDWSSHLAAAPQRQMEIFAAPFWILARCGLSRFHQQKAQHRISLLRDVSQSPPLPTGFF